MFKCLKWHKYYPLPAYSWEIWDQCCAAKSMNLLWKLPFVKRLGARLETFDIASEKTGQKTSTFKNWDCPSQSMVLIRTVPFTGTERIVSSHPCSSIWYELPEATWQNKFLPIQNWSFHDLDRQLRYSRWNSKTTGDLNPSPILTRVTDSNSYFHTLGWT